MKKGSYLEREIDRVLKFLDTRGIHGHKNHPKRLNDGTYIEGEPFDYEVFSPPLVLRHKRMRVRRVAAL